MLTSSYPLPGDPGWGPFLRDHARAVQARGHRVTVLTPSLTRGLQVFRDRGGLRVVAYPYSLGTPPMLHCDQGLMPSVRRSWLARLQLPGFLAAGVYYLALCVHRYRPDVVHAHWFIPGGLAAAIGKPLLGIPLVTLGHGADLHLPNRPLVRRALAYVHRRSDVSLVVSRYLQGRVAGYGLPETEFQVALNGVDTVAFTPGRRREDGTFVVGVARRLVPEKQVRDVIDAVARMSGMERKGIALRIAGDGAERRRLEEHARATGIAGQVTFLGSVPHREMPAYLRGIDVLVNPSTQEGLSTGNLEALASGVPVIACRGVGNDEVIEDGRTGVLYPARDVDALKNAIREVGRSPGILERMAREARTLVVEKFSLDRAARDWEGAYLRALRRFT